MTDQTVSRNLFTRPAEEHFPDMPTITQHASDQRKRSRVVFAGDEGVKFKNGALSIWHGVPAKEEMVIPTAYAWGTLAGVCGIPVEAITRLRVPTRDIALNELWRPDHDERDARGYLLEDTVQGPMVRAINSGKYERVWDDDILRSVDRWLVNSEVRWVPAYPEKNTDQKGTNIMGNTKPALFRSDRDLFCFFMGERDTGDGPTGGLRRGIYVWNSEVGTESFGFSSFVFDSMCANFLVWGMRDRLTRTARHVGTVHGTWQAFGDLLRTEADRMCRVSDEELAMITQAHEREWVRDLPPNTTWEEVALDKLASRYKIGSRTGKQVLDAMGLPENQHRRPGSVWAVVSGITSWAKTLPYARQRLDMQRKAGEVLCAEVGR